MKGILFTFFVLGFILTSAAFYGTDPAVAGGGAGGGGGAGCTGTVQQCKGHHTSYGWGWRIFSKSAGPTHGFSNGTQWWTVQNKCTDSASVAVFVVLDKNGDTKGFDYHPSGYDGLTLYKGDSGAPYITNAAARAAFNSLPASLRAGYTFGVNLSWFCYGVISWNISGSTGNPTPSSVTPGQPVSWQHKLTKTNTGNPGNISYDIQRKSGSGGYTNVASGSWNPSSANPDTNNGSSLKNSYTPIGSDIGKQVCERIRWTPTSSTNTGTSYSTEKCVTVISDKGVSPTLTIGPSVVSDGESFTANFLTTNEAIIDTQIRYTAWVWYEKNGTNGYGAGDTRIYNHATNGWPNPADNGSDTMPVLPHNSTNNQTLTFTDFANLSLGSKVCAAWRIESTNPWVPTKVSGFQISCIVVGLKPKLQVWGHDVRTNKSIMTSLSTGSTGTYGSWGEYALFSGDVNMNMASASAFANGNPSANQSNWKTLTAANSGGCPYGCFASSTYPTETAKSLKQLAGACLPNGSLISGATDVTDTRYICVNGTARITGNITYKPTSLQAQLPQVVIIAKNIEIDPTVTQLDAWLVAYGNIDNSGAKGVVYTCGSSPGWKTAATQLVIGQCDKQLKINGPVIADQVFFGRTYAPDMKSPAEIVNLRADTYVWAAQGTGAVTVETISTKELPPRY